MNQVNKSNPVDAGDGLIRIFRAVVLVCVTIFLGYTVYTNAVTENGQRPFKLGLDLAGGSHLVYEADVSQINPLEVTDLMNVLRNVIEKRVNSLGTEENVVYVEQSSFVTEEPQYRLVVELPGVTDVSAAVAEIGNTPLLEFKLINEEAANEQQLQLSALTPNEDGSIDANVTEQILANLDELYIDTGLTGRYLESAALEFTAGQSGQLAGEPIVSIRFNSEGGQLFEQITRNNVGQRLAIFLDGEVISSPRINEAIPGGTAIISGGFTPVEARELAQNLNFGALPMPIALVSTQTIGATLGAEVLEKGMFAGMVGFVLVALFMIGWYRLPGLVAIVALVSYVVAMLALFQYLPVTLTAAGLAGFVLSLGIAVDANVLVFERMKEELRAGSSTRMAARVGFARAWSAIRDGNATSILSAIILFWFGTAMVKGFALVFGLGVVISMLSALVITRTLLMAIPDQVATKRSWLWGINFRK
jgi:preprotein translocase subunit SecD